MVTRHHQLDAHEFEQALGVGDGQGSMVCCSPWGRKESDMSEQLKCTEPKWRVSDLSSLCMNRLQMEYLD